MITHIADDVFVGLDINRQIGNGDEFDPDLMGEFDFNKAFDFVSNIGKNVSNVVKQVRSAKSVSIQTPSGVTQFTRAGVNYQNNVPKVVQAKNTLPFGLPPIALGIAGAGILFLLLNKRK